MSRSTALDPIMTRNPDSRIFIPEPAKTQSQPQEVVCSYKDTSLDQTIIMEPAGGN